MAAMDVDMSEENVAVEEEEEIGQEDAWTVISSFFEEKGLARQQLASRSSKTLKKRRSNGY